MDFLNYKAEDFASDESFIAYHIKSDPDAIAFWENWGRIHPQKLDEIAAAEQLLDMLTVRLPQHEFEQEKEKLVRHITSSEIMPLPSFERRNYWLIAASVSILLCIGAVYLFSGRGENKLANVSVEWLHVTNPNGKKSLIKLADGSIVTLNAASTLHYPKAFVKGKREVRLEGEAYFSVSHNPSKPFIVHAGPLNTEVLGTEFNISAYGPKENISVALVKGKVKVTASAKETILLPGRKAEYSPSSKTLEESALDAVSDIGWKQNRLVFKNASFETIAKAIERTYGYKLINQSTDKNWNYTGSFDNQTMHSVIDNICFSKHLKYKIEKQTIYLSTEK